MGNIDVQFFSRGLMNYCFENSLIFSNTIATNFYSVFISKNWHLDWGVNIGSGGGALVYSLDGCGWIYCFTKLLKYPSVSCLELVTQLFGAEHTMQPTFHAQVLN